MADRTQRYLALLGDLDPIEVLSATPIRLEEWLLSASREAFDTDAPAQFSSAPGRAGPSPVGSTPRALLAHLADYEVVTGFRLRQLAAVPGAELQSVDHGAWSRHYQRLEPSISFEAFRALRSLNLALLAGFSLEDWLAEGFHPERGFESCDQIVRQLAGHDLESLLEFGIDARGPGSRSSSR